MSVHALAPVRLDELERGEQIIPAGMTALAPSVLADEVTAGDARTLKAITANAPLVLPRLRTLDPVPVYLATDATGTTWWGGYGPPTTTMTGAEPGDYYIDYTDGEVYRLVADDYGEIA